MITVFRYKMSLNSVNPRRTPGVRLASMLLAGLCLFVYLAGAVDFPAVTQAAPLDQKSKGEVRRLFEESLAVDRKRIENWERILKEYPGSEYAIYIQAEGVDSYRKQIRYYDRALAINAKFFEAYIERARAKAELENLQGALADIERALKIRPHDFGAFIDRGDYRQRSGRFREALADFSRALNSARTKNDSGLALLFRGETQLEMGDARAAVGTANEALKLLASNPQILYLRGRAYLKAGNKIKACRDLSRAIQLGENLAEMQYNRFCKK